MKKLMISLSMLLCLSSFARELYPEETIASPDSSYAIVLLKNIVFNDFRKSIYFSGGKIISKPQANTMYCELANGRDKKEKISLEAGNKFVVDNSFGYSWEKALALRIWRQYWLMKSNDDVQFFSCVNDASGDINYKKIKSAVGSYLKLTRN